MGMFDTASVINVADENFKHNGICYQTKSLDCTCSEYIIFNGQLWQQRDGEASERFPEAVEVDFSGELNIYTDYSLLDRMYWIEYDLTFVGGKLDRVVVVSEQLTEDRSDKSKYRPSSKSTSSYITLEFGGVEGQIYDAFHSDIDHNLDRLREAIGDPKAEIAYQVKSPKTGLHSFGAPTRWLHSVVQHISDFDTISSGKVSKKDSDGNSLTIVMDEAHEFWAGD